MTEAWDGRPQNPERDGWHWLHLDSPGYATAVPCLWEDSGWILPGVEEVIFPEAMIGTLAKHGRAPRYLGPCLTPAEVEARVAEARQQALKEAWGIVADWPVPEDGATLHEIIVRDEAIMTAIEDAAAIRALKERGNE